ncbi:MAG: lipoate--protein ligase [Chloroflexi bacterium]|nr:MAG: lipoate--protein ligase [Chloroflexota bacterium]
MIYVDNQNITDPRLNLALEEFLLRHVRLEEPILLFYVNEPSVILGRNQNVWEEVDWDYVEKNGVSVVRRLSGGGAVYHDEGNLNFSFISTGSENLHNFRMFTEPVIRVLNQLGVPAELHGKSDIYAGGKKMSGNAQYLSGQRMVSHGTILFNSDLEALLHALNPGQVQIASRAVQSIRAKVTNIIDWLPEMDMTVLRKELLTGIFEGYDAIPTYELTEAEWAKVWEMKAARYDTWEWNNGRSPKFTVRKTQNSTQVDISVERGCIKSVNISGEKLNLAEIEQLHTQLVGVRYQRQEITAVLAEQELASPELIKLFI